MCLFMILKQVGTGKTTALNFLPDEKIYEKFHVIPLYATDLFDMVDIDIADVLFVLCHQLMEESGKARKKFKKEIEKIQRVYEGTMEINREEEVGRKVEGGGNMKAGVSLNPFTRFLGLLKVEANLLADIRMDSNTRQMVRKMFNVKKRDIFEVANKIIDAFIEEKGEDKEVLIIFNELDHIRKPESITKLFIDNRNYLDSLQCKKIISVPVILSTYPEFKGNKEVGIQHLGLKIKQNPVGDKVNPKSARIIKENKALLRQLPMSRIEEGIELIDEAALNLAIDKSGGLIRQYVSILVNAGRRVRMMGEAKISKNDIEEAAHKERLDLEGSLIGLNKIKLLEQIRQEGDPATEDKNLLIEAFLANQIISVKNEPTWYYLNPLIEKTVEIYARNIDKDDD